MSSSDDRVRAALAGGLLSAAEGAALRALLEEDPERTWSEALHALGGLPAARLPALEALATMTAEPGRYQERYPLGRGGMGVVRAMEDRVLGRVVAMKQLARGGADAGERFAREAQITAQLEHPGIVPVYEMGVAHDGTPYYTMKRVDGRTLADALRDAGDLSGRMALLGPFAASCQALAYAHSRGVVHRDLKPQNIMIGAFGETIVLDWGLAKKQGVSDVSAPDAGEPPDSEAALTPRGARMGTPAYMSPEQAAGGFAELDARSDVWSLGAILFEILEGRRAVAADEKSTAIHQILAGQWRLPVMGPPELRAVVGRAMARDPALRYADAAGLAADVEAFRTGALVSAHRYSRIERWRRELRRLAGPLALALVAGMVLAGTARVIRSERHRATAQSQAAETQRELLRVRLVTAAEQDPNPSSALARLIAAESLSDPSARMALFASMERAIWRGSRPSLTAPGPAGPTAALMPGERIVDSIQSPTGVELALVVTGASQPGQGRGDDVSYALLTATAGQAGPRVAVPYPVTWAFSASGMRFASGGVDGCLTWTDGPRQVGSACWPGVRFLDVAWVGEGTRLLALVDADGEAPSVRELETASGELKRQFVVPRTLYAISASPDGGTIAGFLSTGAVVFWREGVAAPILSFEPGGARVTASAWSPSGRWFAFGTASGGGGVRDLASGGSYGLEPHHFEVEALAFSPGGDRLASLGADDQLRVYNLNPFTVVASFEDPRFGGGLRFMAGGDALLTACDGVPCTVPSRAFDPGRARREAGDMTPLRVCPDGERLVASSPGEDLAWAPQSACGP